MSGNKWKKHFNFVAFVALVFIGIAVLLSAIIPSISQAFLTIALILAVGVAAFYGFFYAYKGGKDSKGKWSSKQMLHLSIWFAALVLCIVGIVLMNII